jgi:hypothetical protein
VVFFGARAGGTETMEVEVEVEELGLGFSTAA